MQEKPYKIYNHKKHIDIYIFGEILETSIYSKALNTIRNADRNIKLYINSPGGLSHAALAIINAIGDCPTHVTTIGQGEVYSAATMIWAVGDTIIADEHSEYMFHNYENNVYGQPQSQKIAVNFAQNAWFKLVWKVYKGILSNDEIASMLDGKEIWLGADQLNVRLQD